MFIGFRGTNNTVLERVRFIEFDAFCSFFMGTIFGCWTGWEFEDMEYDRILGLSIDFLGFLRLIYFLGSLGSTFWRFM